MRAILGDEGTLIIGADLKKDVRRLIAAYDDAEGVTAAFNLNLLKRANTELGADFDLGAFSTSPPTTCATAASTCTLSAAWRRSSPFSATASASPPRSASTPSTPTSMYIDGFRPRRARWMAPAILLDGRRSPVQRARPRRPIALDGQIALKARHDMAQGRPGARRGYHHGNLREALIAAALDLISKKGPGGFTFADAARAAGVSPAAPYRHFRDRDALMADIARRGFDAFAEGFVALLGLRPADPALSLRARRPRLSRLRGQGAGAVLGHVRERRAAGRLPRGA